MFAYDYFKNTESDKSLLVLPNPLCISTCLYHDDLGKTMCLIGNIEDTKEITRSRKLKKDILHNGQQEKDKKDSSSSKCGTHRVTLLTTW